MGFERCMVYLAMTGFLFFLLGRVLPKKWFDSDEAPFKRWEFEREGKLYDRFLIRRWKDKVPDMSKLFPSWMPTKSPGQGKRSLEEIEALLRETCVAETVHSLLAIAGAGCLYLWPGAGGMLLTVLWAAGNIPFIMIQRYNRPRFRGIRDRLRRETSEKDCVKMYRGETA